MAERIRLGVAGCGAIAQAVHLPLLQRHPNVDVVAIAEAEPAQRQRTAARWSVPHAYASLDEMLTGASLDGVVVALPSAQHASAGIAVLNAGCHLYIEKPTATTLDEALALQRAWYVNRRVAVAGFNCRFNPLFHQLKSLLKDARAGTLTFARCAFATAPREQPSWRQRRRSGGGVLLDLAPHHLDLLRWLFDTEIERIRATIRSNRSDDDTALLEVHLATGLAVHCYFSMASAEHEIVEVHGSRACLSVSRFTSLRVNVTGNPGDVGIGTRMKYTAESIRHLPAWWRARRAPLREPGYALLLDAFAQSIRSGHMHRTLPTLDDAFACVAAIDAAERSSGSGQFESARPGTPSTANAEGGDAYVAAG